MSKYILPVKIYTSIEVEADNLKNAIENVYKEHDRYDIGFIINNRGELNDCWDFDKHNTIIKDGEPLVAKGEETEWMGQNEPLAIIDIADMSIY